MFERFTKDARAIVRSSVAVAAGYDSDVEPVHLMIALAELQERAGSAADPAGSLPGPPSAPSGTPVPGLAGRVLARHGVTAALLRDALAGGTGHGTGEAMPAAPAQPPAADPATVPTADPATDATTGAAFTDEEIAALRSIGIDAEEVLRRIEGAFGAGALHAGPPPGRDPGRDRSRTRARRRPWDGPFGSPARKVLELTLREALALRHRELGAEHILLALLRTGLPAPVARVLEARGMSYAAARREIVAESGRAA